MSFLSGAYMMALFTIGLHFLRFWLETREKFFLNFLVAFWLLAFERILLAWQPPGSDGESLYYLIRLVAFFIVMAAILNKSRSRLHID